MKLAICIVAYNREFSLKRLVCSLLQADYSNQIVDLIVSIDKSDSKEVPLYADSIVWKYGKKRVVKHPINLGLRKHILGIGGYFSEYDALIVLEDDVIVSPNFIRYATQCIEKYADDDRIAGISLYNFNINYQNYMPFIPLKDDNDVYFMNCAQSWGQIWMKNQWNAFYDWYKDNQEEFSNLSHLPDSINRWPKSSWLKYHTRYCIEKNKYFVYPYFALSTNNSDAGTHVSVASTLFQSRLSFFPIPKFKLPSLDESNVFYDGFFENKRLHEYLNLDSSEITIDLYGGKKNHQTPYLLTMNVLDYKIIKTFGLRYKPIELNICFKCEGNAIFLYDTTIVQKNKTQKNIYEIFNYFFEVSVIRMLRRIGVKEFLRNVLKR